MRDVLEEGGFSIYLLLNVARGYIAGREGSAQCPLVCLFFFGVRDCYVARLIDDDAEEVTFPSFALLSRIVSTGFVLPSWSRYAWEFSRYYG